jgi:arabinofuranosyltransferase
MPSRRLLIALSCAFVAIILLRSAWVSDDAYRVLRSVEHAIDGYGLRWNVSERVHVFEEPLWLLLLIAVRAIVGDAYAAALGLGLACAMATTVIVLRCGRTEASIAIGAAILSLSAAFVTWSSSGMGDPLAHLIVALFAVRWLGIVDGADGVDGRAADRVLWLLAGLAALTRLETLAITTLPLIERVRARGIPASLPGVAILFAPLAAWGVAAAWYFGSPVPNPAIARHADAVPWVEQVQLGAGFLGDALRRDPLTLAVVACAVLATAARPSRARTLMAGVTAYVALLVLVGGSADGERLLGVALVAAAIVVLTDVRIARPAVAGGVLGAIVVLGASSARATLAADASFGSSAFETMRVHDARAADYQATGLLRWARESRPPRHPEAARGMAAQASAVRAATSDRPGFFGWAAGPGVHVIDAHGGGDPLLAHLPPAVGSFGYGPRIRRLPEGFKSSIERGTTLVEPPLAALDARVHEVAAGRLRDPQRLFTAWRLATGAFRPLIDQSSYGTRTVPLDALRAAGRLHEGSPPDTQRVLEGGLRVELGARQPVRRVELAITGSSDVAVDLMDGTSLVARMTSRAAAAPEPGLSSRFLAARRAEIASALVVRCGRGPSDCRVGYVGVAR